MDNTIEKYISSLPLNTQIIQIDNCNLLSSVPDLTDFFDLREFICYNSNLNKIPNLPNSIVKINVHHNFINNIDNICNLTNLEYLNISYNDLIVLPNLSKLKKLKILNCTNNFLRKIIKLPNSLELLNCSYNKLIKLGPFLPNSLRKLFCFYNKLENISTFNKKLEICHCYGNNLKTLPKINKNLKILFCFDNKLIELPELKHALKLKELYCQQNNIKIMPELPSSLIELACSQNKLVKIPYLHNGLKEIYFYNNLIIELPIIPETCTVLNFGKNPIYYIMIKIINITDNWEELNKISTILQKFKFNYHVLRFKKQIHQWLWKSKERSIQMQFHPSEIEKKIQNIKHLYLTDIDALDFLENMD